MRDLWVAFQRYSPVSTWILFVALAAIGRPASYASPPAPDMGQYMYVGGVVLDGGTPYVDVANNKGPANFLLWAVLRGVSGDSPVGLRIMLLLVAGFAALALSAYVAHYAGRAAGLLAGATLALLSSSFALEAFDPNNAQFGIAPMIGGWALATRGGAAAAFGTGALAAFAALLNPAFALAAPFAAWELWRSTPPDNAARRRIAALALAGVAAVGGFFALWLGLAGALDDMVIQVFGQVSRAVEADSPGGGLPGATQSIDAPLGFLVNIPDSLLWIAGLAGSVVAMRVRALRPAAIAAALWIVASIARIEIASYSFPNQYVPGLAGISAGLALGIASVWSGGVRRRLALAALVLAPLIWSAVAAPQLRQLGIPAEDRGNSLVSDAADFLEATTDPGDTVAVAGYDPQVLWLADRRAPSRFFDPFGLSQRDEYVAERREDLFARPPAAVVALPLVPLDPDLEDLLDTGAYVRIPDLEFDVWLRRDQAPAKNAQPGA